MDATDQSNLLSSITLMKELKSLIKNEAQALFSIQHPTNHGYDVILSKTHGGAGYEYEARLIVYTARSAGERYSEWMLLLVNPCLCESPVDAMADLLEGVYERAGRMVEGVKKGNVFRGGVE
ncbi:hypothetical protein EKO04_005979 [Ascochyta lentis]|uniref:Uncharacterized protein n=1 Tax=Ascochyta lentis TaxID=205686 RepID=A0A8H7J3C9_9PLEO|nr:hypothetical protein EKO04_005979 [Ascochyta lentis]